MIPTPAPIQVRWAQLLFQRPTTFFEKELQQIASGKRARGRFKRSVFASALFLISIVSNIPGYFFPVGYTSIVLALTTVSLIAIVLATAMATANLIGYCRDSPLKG